MSAPQTGSPAQPQQISQPPCIQLPAALQGITLEVIISKAINSTLIALGPFALYGILCTIGLIFRHSAFFGWLWVACVGISCTFPDVVTSLQAYMDRYAQSFHVFEAASAIIHLTQSIGNIGMMGGDMQRQRAPEVAAGRPGGLVTIEEVGEPQ